MITDLTSTGLNALIAERKHLKNLLALIKNHLLMHQQFTM